jgi:protein-tyrosine phosphatase
MITWINEKIAIGNAQDSINVDNTIFNSVLNVAIDFDIKDNFRWRHKVGLVDGPGNDPLTFYSAVLLLESLVKQGKKVLVHCHEGKSRSVMVVATWLSMRGLSNLDDALKSIMALREVGRYRPELYSMATITLPTLKQIFTINYK